MGSLVLVGWILISKYKLNFKGKNRNLPIFVFHVEMSKWNGISTDAINLAESQGKDAGLSSNPGAAGADGASEETKKKKKKSKGGKGDKEKPLLTVQGVLRLERSFVTAQHADAEVIMVRKDENEEAEPMRLVPGGGEHEHVSYKTGYDMGPANPLPTNEPESEMYEAMKKVDEKEEQFEALKKQSDIERKEREAKFRRENLIPED